MAKSKKDIKKKIKSCKAKIAKQQKKMKSLKKKL